ncbi:hypothetical protein L6164_035553 [Bauhinia variegata]|uniref:Uncharacterized protein n=1 Tax=Bauhinia variegata TaxID=167791 RepID=A0ACB9KEC1_BAUVA|nr:hypothetical protein L6164_035553 [Bauhinia variegata]
MESKQIAEVVKDSEEGGITEKKKTLFSDLHSDQKEQRIDSASALQRYLDHIPISSIPGIKNSLVLELKTGDSVKDAIRTLYENNIFCAPIADVLDPNGTSTRFSNRCIGIIGFASMVLWCLEEYENIRKNSNDSDQLQAMENNGLFSILDQIPQIGQTKVGELAKSFLWESFFPVRLEDTLFHALLLLSKHQLQVLPVIEQSNSQLIGFATQSAVVQLLLQSSGLAWFDSIADKALSDFRFENQQHPITVFGDQIVADALHLLWKSRIGAVAIVDRETTKLIGTVRNSDVYQLVKKDDLLRSIRSLTVVEFILMETDKVDSDPTIERDLDLAAIAAGSLQLRNSLVPRMDSPVTNKKTETLKQFAPPCVNSSIKGGGFFELALEQSGCHVTDGMIICNH